MKVCFLIPACNEAATIGEVLERIAALELDCNVVVVDDGFRPTTPRRSRRPPVQP